MPKLYLHIGMNKAGSTSCQRLFHSQAAALEAGGIRYLPGDQSNHSYLMAACFGTADAQMRASRRLGITHDEAIGRWRAFVTACGSTGIDGLISAEMLGGGSELGLAQLHEDALAGFDSLVVLMLVRPPLAYARSLAQQWIKRRTPLSVYRDDPPLPNFRGKLERYIALVGRNSVRLEIFHRDRMHEGDPAQALFAMMGRHEGPLAGLRAGHANSAMSMPAAKLLSALHEIRLGIAPAGRIPAIVAAALESLPAGYGYDSIASGAPLSRRLVTLAKSVPGPPFRLPVDVQREVIARSAEQSDWISELIGARLADYDIPIDEDAPLLADAVTIATEEAEIIANHLLAVIGARARA